MRVYSKESNVTTNKKEKVSRVSIDNPNVFRMLKSDMTRQRGDKGSLSQLLPGPHTTADLRLTRAQRSLQGMKIAGCELTCSFDLQAHAVWFRDNFAVAWMLDDQTWSEPVEFESLRQAGESLITVALGLQGQRLIKLIDLETGRSYMQRAESESGRQAGIVRGLLHDCFADCNCKAPAAHILPPGNLPCAHRESLWTLYDQKQLAVYNEWARQFFEAFFPELL